MTGDDETHKDCPCRIVGTGNRVFGAVLASAQSAKILTLRQDLYTPLPTNALCRSRPIVVQHPPDFHIQRAFSAITARVVLPQHQLIHAHVQFRA